MASCVLCCFTGPVSMLELNIVPRSTGKASSSHFCWMPVGALPPPYCAPALRCMSLQKDIDTNPLSSGYEAHKLEVGRGLKKGQCCTWGCGAGSLRSQVHQARPACDPCVGSRLLAAGRSSLAGGHHGMRRTSRLPPLLPSPQPPHTMHMLTPVDCLPSIHYATTRRAPASAQTMAPT